MDKKTFISELEQALSVLQEEELRDIMEEYEQHIDMKVQRGLKMCIRDRPACWSFHGSLSDEASADGRK